MQLIWAPIGLVVFFPVMGLMETGRLEDGITKLRESFWPVVQANWMVRPAPHDQTAKHNTGEILPVFMCRSGRQYNMPILVTFLLTTRKARSHMPSIHTPRRVDWNISLVVFAGPGGERGVVCMEHLLESNGQSQTRCTCGHARSYITHTRCVPVS
jgi:hypothetical protein